MGSCAKRGNIRNRIIWCLWYMMKLRSCLRRKHQSGVQNWRCCSFASAGCRRRGLLRAPNFSTFPRPVLGCIDTFFASKGQRFFILAVSRRLSMPHSRFLRMFRTFGPCLRISAQFLQIVLGFLNEFLTVNISEILMRVILQNFNACVYMSERCLSKFPTANLI